METSYSIIQGESEYRILLAPANLFVLSEKILFDSKKLPQ